MPQGYQPAHSHVKHARARDPDLYYKIILMAFCGFDTKQIATLTGTPIQTISRNFKAIRRKLTLSENYRVEVYNRFYHADPKTGDHYGHWRDYLRELQPGDNHRLTETQQDRTERLIGCLKDCPLGKPPKQYVAEHLQLGLYNSTAIPEIFEPRRYRFPLQMPVLQDIDANRAYFDAKERCARCPLKTCGDKEKILGLFRASPYLYIDITYHLSRFHPKKPEDYHDHFYFAWANGCLRGTHHMTANKTATSGLSEEEALQISNDILIDFVDLTYDAIAGKAVPSLPVKG